MIKENNSSINRIIFKDKRFEDEGVHLHCITIPDNDYDTLNNNITVDGFNLMNINLSQIKTMTVDGSKVEPFSEVVGDELYKKSFHDVIGPVGDDSSIFKFIPKHCELIIVSKQLSDIIKRDGDLLNHLRHRAFYYSKVFINNDKESLTLLADFLTPAIGDTMFPNGVRSCGNRQPGDRNSKDIWSDLENFRIKYFSDLPENSHEEYYNSYIEKVDGKSLSNRIDSLENIKTIEFQYDYETNEIILKDPNKIPSKNMISHLNRIDFLDILNGMVYSQGSMIYSIFNMFDADKENTIVQYLRDFLIFQFNINPIINTHLEGFDSPMCLSEPHDLDMIFPKNNIICRFLFQGFVSFTETHENPYSKLSRMKRTVHNRFGMCNMNKLDGEYTDFFHNTMTFLLNRKCDPNVKIPQTLRSSEEYILIAQQCLENIYFALKDHNKYIFNISDTLQRYQYSRVLDSIMQKVDEGIPVFRYKDCEFSSISTVYEQERIKLSEMYHILSIKNLFKYEELTECRKDVLTDEVMANATNVLETRYETPSYDHFINNGLHLWCINLLIDLEEAKKIHSKRKKLVDFLNTYYMRGHTFHQEEELTALLSRNNVFINHILNIYTGDHD